MEPALLDASETTVIVLGAGRLGNVLARALDDAGFDVRGPLGRHDAIPDADIALLCVPDAQIAPAAAAARPHARSIGHLSGATALDDVDFGLHPLQTFTGTEGAEVFHGIGAAIAGRTEAAEKTARQLARALGARPFVVDDVHRSSYHAAASFASNFVLTALDSAQQLAAAAGIADDEAREMLAPLVRRTVENWVVDGAATALTGPIARGDEATVSRQRAGVGADAPQLLGLFDALADATRALAHPARVSEVSPA